jgi:hypothetical protein
MNTVAAMIILCLITMLMLGTTFSSTDFALAKSKKVSNEKAANTESAQLIHEQPNTISTDSLLVDQFSSTASSPINTLQTTQAFNPLLDMEEFDLTVSNIKHENITVAITIDGAKNSTIIPGNPPNVINPTSKVVVFKFDRHENAKTPAVFPIKLGDQYTACISFTSNQGAASCITATLDSVTQPQKKAFDANYIPS